MQSVSCACKLLQLMHIHVLTQSIWPSVQQLQELQEETRKLRFELEEWRSRAQALEREADTLRDNVRVLREQLTAANALTRDHALNVEIQQVKRRTVHPPHAHARVVSLHASYLLFIIC
jgi:predicted  nucleic acid-binding Zn-ribbon protein